MTHTAPAEEQLRNLIASVAYLADCGTPEEYADCFTADAVWTVQSDEFPAASSTLRGREAILAGVTQRRAEGIQGPGSRTAHEVSTTVLDVEGTRATARSLFSFFRATNNGPVLVAIGRYTDTFTLDAGSWRVSSRTVDQV